MLDIAEELHRWCGEGRAFAVATVVAVEGSAPRQPGAALAVDAGGTAVGSVSGGCVEGAVYELCRAALESGESVRERFGYSDEDAFAVGLTCGGVLDVLVVPVRPDGPGREVLAEALAAATAGEPVALARVVDGPDGALGRALLVRPDGTYGGTLAGSVVASGPGSLDCVVAAEAAALLAAGRTATVTTGVNSAAGARCGDPVTVLVESCLPPPRMIVFGAVDFAAALVRAGKFLGHHVTVCDARPVFATTGRFPEADEVAVDWPHRYLDAQEAAGALDARTVLCVLTHDAKFDVPLLERALRLPVAYVGAMGSRRTHEARLGRLREAGVGERALNRLRSPIGLDLGARTPEETALSIAAEIVAVRHGGTGAPLTGARTPIHREPRRGLGSVA
ncbi:XdhC family protein [Streptomyces roseoverticillatus]|uniref:XdhC family protein n=1 Tax=Streptomyces roseoverticillatus TaxID=66429 RepID=UPI001F2C6C11|nr:XdhC/CoxI family protein [Streptomyces roseoverticillatus]MCF3102440.1 XdhC family protein [Streptomyces roseoverticillatus]